MNTETLSPSERHESMRGYFAYYLHESMRVNPDVYCLTGDLGFGMLDKIKKDFPDRFINTGAAEQSLVGISVGLAMSGKIPVVYSITPFLLYRPFETIRNYIDREKIKVILVGGGRDTDYEYDGFSHWSTEDERVMELFKNIQSFWPKDKEEIKELLEFAIDSDIATYINLKR